MRGFVHVLPEQQFTDWLRVQEAASRGAAAGAR
jgi:heme/copper-type cytochrome/quinol oxidase subunit 2